MLLLPLIDAKMAPVSPVIERLHSYSSSLNAILKSSLKLTVDSEVDSQCVSEAEYESVSETVSETDSDDSFSRTYDSDFWQEDFIELSYEGDEADLIDFEAVISKANIVREVSKVNNKDTSTLASLVAKGDQEQTSEEDKPSRVFTFVGPDEMQLAMADKKLLKRSTSGRIPIHSDKRPKKSRQLSTNKTMVIKPMCPGLSSR